MKYQQKTEHNGAKKGRGAFRGRKVDAKATSNKLRRKNGKQEIAEQEVCV